MKPITVPITRITELEQAINTLSQISIKETGRAVVIKTGYEWIDGNRVIQVQLISSPDAYTTPALTAIEQAHNDDDVTQPVLPKTEPPSPESEYVGKEGLPVELSVELYAVITIQGDYGLSHIHKMREGKNELVWFSSREKHQLGNYTVKGRVTAHQPYEDSYHKTTIKQTKLVRCKFTKIKQTN
jgi:hypothetical protein